MKLQKKTLKWKENIIIHYYRSSIAELLLCIFSIDFQKITSKSIKHKLIINQCGKIQWNIKHHYICMHSTKFDDTFFLMKHEIYLFVKTFNSSQQEKINWLEFWSKVISLTDSIVIRSVCMLGFINRDTSNHSKLPYKIHIIFHCTFLLIKITYFC